MVQLIGLALRARLTRLILLPFQRTEISEGSRLLEALLPTLAIGLLVDALLHEVPGGDGLPSEVES